MDRRYFFIARGAWMRVERPEAACETGVLVMVDVLASEKYNLVLQKRSFDGVALLVRDRQAKTDSADLGTDMGLQWPDADGASVIG